MSATKEKKLTRVACLRKQGIHVPLTAAISLANAFPGPIKDGSLERRYTLSLARKGWIAPLSNPASMGELPDYEITPAGAIACKKIAAAEVEYQQQRKNGKGAIPG